MWMLLTLPLVQKHPHVATYPHVTRATPWTAAVGVARKVFALMATAKPLTTSRVMPLFGRMTLARVLRLMMIAALVSGPRQVVLRVNVGFVLNQDIVRKGQIAVLNLDLVPRGT
eukprot:Rmarinus@m.9761